MCSSFLRVVRTRAVETTPGERAALAHAMQDLHRPEESHDGAALDAGPAGAAAAGEHTPPFVKMIR